MVFCFLLSTLGVAARSGIISTASGTDSFPNPADVHALTYSNQ